MWQRFRTGDKKRAEIKHALRRAMERYGLHLTEQDLNLIRKAIQAGASQCVNKQTWRVSVHDLRYMDTDIRVVYDKERKSIVSFLTHEMGVWEEGNE